MPVFRRTEISWLALIAPLALIVALCAVWALQITARPLVKDAAQTTWMAANLAHHGVISLDEEPPFAPSDYREPLPVMVSAVGIRLLDATYGSTTSSGYLSGWRARLLKFQTLAWLVLLAAGAFWSARRLTHSLALGLLAVLLVNIPFVGGGAGEWVNDLDTDIPAAAVLVWACGVLSVAFVSRRPSWIATAGALLGALTLIKAATLYVAAGIAVCWVTVRLHRKLTDRAIGTEIGVLLLSFACVVAPWMLRNAAQTGSFEVAKRAGVVLMYRALHDEMTAREFVGGFYLWAPHGLQHPLGSLLAFSPADTERGGALQRLNDAESDFAAQDLAAEQAGRPDRAISFYRQARAERVYWENRFTVEHHAEPETDADAVLRARALSIITAHPLRHVALTALFLWRGAAKTFPLLALALLIAIRNRRESLAVFVLPALGIVLLYGSFTHFVPRYDLPPRAVAAVAVAALAGFIWERLGARQAAAQRTSA